MPLTLLFQKMTFATNSLHRALYKHLLVCNEACHGSVQQPALGGRLVAPEMAEGTTGTQKLYIFCASLAKISFPAWAMLCCFWLSGSLGFSFADGFLLVPFGDNTGAFGWHFHALLAY